jgi:hypothetical protein
MTLEEGMEQELFLLMVIHSGRRQAVVTLQDTKTRTEGPVSDTVGQKVMESPYRIFH